jgi:hypothetical protein
MSPPDRPARLLLTIACALAPVVAFAQAGGEAAPAPASAPAPTSEAAPAEGTPARVVLTPEAQQQLSAADRERASRLEQEANQLYGEGRYKEAIEKYRLSHEITGDPNLLYSIAVAYQQLEAWQECVSNMEKYLEKAPPGPKRDRAENTMKSCDARIVQDQRFTIESDPSGASVFLDTRERSMGSTPVTTFVRPGKHTIWVELPGYEPVQQDVEVQTKEPFRLALTLQRIQNVGWLYVDCNIIDATVFIDGKNVGLTPFKEPLAYPAGRHQVVVDRDGFTRFDQHVGVDKGKIATVDAKMVPRFTPSTWRSPVGWTANVLGALSIAGGIVFWQLADKEYNDTQKFKDYAFYEKLGYGVGGGLLAVGTGLIIWDAVRDEVPAEQRNPSYGEPAKVPATASIRVVPLLGARSIGFGVTF